MINIMSCFKLQYPLQKLHAFAAELLHTLNMLMRVEDASGLFVNTQTALHQ